MKPLLAYAGKRKVLIYVAIVLAAVSQLMALAPFLCIWAILRDVIARAFLKDAPIILMDEATASLDVENETFIQESLSRLVKDKTVILIAHRMRTVAGADKIVVLEDGKVAECGTPVALAASGGFYARMQELQRQAQDWNI